MKQESGWQFDYDDTKPQAITLPNPPMDLLPQLLSDKPIHRLVPLYPAPQEAPQPGPPKDA